MITNAWQAIVIGGSAGGTKVLIQVLSVLPSDYRLPIFVCTHLHVTDDGGYARQLDADLALTVIEAYDKQPLGPGVVHIAPANYHLLIERSRTLALSTTAKVHWARPSIDVLFESAAYVFTTSLVGILLSGANEDGAAGLRIIRDLGGLTIAQDPATAEQPTMPQAAIERQAAARVLSPPEIQKLVAGLQPSRVA